jgi:ribosome-binding protein aMBF1 (putative translation factor)
MQRRLSRPERGKYFSEGARLMWLAIDRLGWSQTELAAKLGTSSGQVSQWLYGGRRASLKWAVTIRDVLDIPLASWNQSPPEGYSLPVASPRATESGRTLVDGAVVAVDSDHSVA